MQVPAKSYPRAFRLAGFASSSARAVVATAAGFLAATRLAFRASMISTTFSRWGSGAAITTVPCFSLSAQTRASFSLANQMLEVPIVFRADILQQFRFLRG